MRKQELLHLHALFSEVSEYLVSNGNDLEMSEYERLNISPVSIQKSKAAHTNAVMTLAQGIASEVEPAVSDASEESAEAVASVS
jgi:hypothetical protein